MKILKWKVQIYLSTYIVVGLIIATAGFAYFYYYQNISEKTSALFAGLVTGLIVAVIQLLFDWREHRQIEEIKALGLKKIIPHRDDEEFYRNLIIQATRRIDVMGVSAVRFMEDFGDESRGRAEKKVLCDALQRRVTVRIIVPEKAYLDPKHQNDFDRAESLFRTVKGKYSNFKYSYFDHSPAHSLVTIDDKCLLGPVFPKLSSKDTPCILMSTDSVYSEKYLEYFEDEWTNGRKGN